MKAGLLPSRYLRKVLLYRVVALLLASVGGIIGIVVADAAPRHTQTWYVSATAAAGGNGSATAPFNSLAQLVTVYGAIG